MVTLHKTVTRERSDLFDASLQGCRQWIISLWSTVVKEPTITVLLNDRFGSDKTIDSRSRRSETGEPFPLPTCDIVPVAVEANTQGYNTFAMQQGIITGFHNNRGSYRREQLTPIQVGMGIQFESKSQDEAILFAQLWVAAGPNLVFIITQPGTGARFYIELKPDRQVSMPKRGENEEDTIQVETTLICNTYAGFTELRPTVKDVNYRFVTPVNEQTDENGDGWIIEPVDLNALRASRTSS